MQEMLRFKDRGVRYFNELKRRRRTKKLLADIRTSEEGKQINFILLQEPIYAFNLERVRQRLSTKLIAEVNKHKPGFINWSDPPKNHQNIADGLDNILWGFDVDQSHKTLKATMKTWMQKPLPFDTQKPILQRGFRVTYFYLTPDHHDFMIKVRDPDTAQSEKEYSLKDLRSSRTSPLVGGYLRQIVEMSGLEWQASIVAN